MASATPSTIIAMLDQIDVSPDPTRPNISPSSFGCFWDVLYKSVQGMPSELTSDIVGAWGLQLMIYAQLLPCQTCRSNWLQTLKSDTTWANVTTRDQAQQWLEKAHATVNSHKKGDSGDWWWWVVAILAIGMIIIVTKK